MMGPPIARARTAPVQYKHRSPTSSLSPPASMRRVHTVDTVDNNSTSFISMFAPSLFGGSDYGSTNNENHHHQVVPEDKYEKSFHELSYSDRDLISILNEDAAFQTLKASLRQRGCVTNAYLQLNLHFYVKHVKDVRAKQQRKELQKKTKMHGNRQRVPRRQRHEKTTP